MDTFVYDNLLEGDSPMVADATWKGNSSMCWTIPGMHRRTGCAAGAVHALQIVVTDRGPGVFGRRARHIGTPYQSTKGGRGRPGLFLLVTVPRKLMAGRAPRIAIPGESGRRICCPSRPLAAIGRGETPTRKTMGTDRLLLIIGRRRSVCPDPAEALVRAARLPGATPTSPMEEAGAVHTPQYPVVDSI